MNKKPICYYSIYDKNNNINFKNCKTNLCHSLIDVEIFLNNLSVISKSFKFYNILKK